MREGDFTQQTKDLLAKKVGYCCSNPFCRRPTIGSDAIGNKAINIGEAAHITAAQPGGPRYDPTLTLKERKSEKNGIWLCRNHAAMIDRDETCFTVGMLKNWKRDAERKANNKIIKGYFSDETVYLLRCLYDDLKSCRDTIKFIEENVLKFGGAIIVPSEQLWVTEKFEEKIGKIVDLIGVNYASRMRKSFIEISYYRDELAKEELRSKEKLNHFADAKVVRYSHVQNRFLEKMKEFNLNELVDTIGKLFSND